MYFNNAHRNRIGFASDRCAWPLGFDSVLAVGVRVASVRPCPQLGYIALAAQVLGELGRLPLQQFLRQQ